MLLRACRAVQHDCWATGGMGNGKCRPSVLHRMDRYRRHGCIFVDAVGLSATAQRHEHHKWCLHRPALQPMVLHFKVLHCFLQHISPGWCSTVSKCCCWCFIWRGTEHHDSMNLEARNGAARPMAKHGIRVIGWHFCLGVQYSRQTRDRQVV